MTCSWGLLSCFPEACRSALSTTNDQSDAWLEGSSSLLYRWYNLVSNATYSVSNREAGISSIAARLLILLIDAAVQYVTFSSTISLCLSWTLFEYQCRGTYWILDKSPPRSYSAKCVKTSPLKWRVTKSFTSSKPFIATVCHFSTKGAMIRWMIPWGSSPGNSHVTELEAINVLCLKAINSLFHHLDDFIYVFYLAFGIKSFP